MTLLPFKLVRGLEADEARKKRDIWMGEGMIIRTKLATEDSKEETLASRTYLRSPALSTAFCNSSSQGYADSAAEGYQNEHPVADLRVYTASCARVKQRTRIFNNSI